MSKQILLNGRGLVASSDRLWGLQGHTNWTTTVAASVVLHAPYALELSNFRVELQTAPGTGDTRIFTIFHGLVDTGITVTFGATDSGVKSDLSNTYSVPADGAIYMKDTQTGVPSTSGIKWSVMIESDDDAKTALMGHCMALTSTTVYLSFAGVMLDAGSATENDHEMVVPCDGTIKDFRINLQLAPGSSKSRTFTVRKNGSDSSLSVDVINLQFQNSDSGSESVSQGDVLAVKHTAANSPTVSNAAWSLTFTPDNRGDFIIGSARAIGHNTLATRFESAQAPRRRVLVNANLSEQLCGDFDITGLTVDLDTAPGSGNSYTYEPAVDGSATGTALVISDTATSGSQSQSVTVSAGSALAVRVTPASVPDSGQTTISYIGFIDDPAPPSGVSVMMMGANF